VTVDNVAGQNAHAPAAASVLRVRRRTLAAVLVAATAAVIGLGLLRYALILAFGRETYFGAFRIINLDGEGTLPAWYSSALMLLAAVLLFTLHRLSVRARPENARPWLVLALIFLLLSLDEAASLHDALTEPLRNVLGTTEGFLYFAWVVAAAPLLVAAAIGFLPLLRRLPPAIARRMMLAGAMFVLGALGMEMVGASQFDGSAGNARYHMAVALEEIGEMTGLVLFVLVLYDLVALTAPALTLRLDKA
jgi:hypothetical protein